MIRVRIVVEGRVQKVGYRDLVQSVARKLGVKGYVENLRDGNVQIVCEAEEEVLDSFVREIGVKEEFIEAERVQVVERSKATGEFGYFEIKYGSLGEEFGDRMGTALEYAKAMRSDIQSMHRDLKSDTTGIKGAIQEMHGDLKDMRGELKEELVGIRGEIRDMHTDLKEDTSGIREAIVEMHKDLKDEIAGVRGDVRNMHVDMSKSFDEMAKRYDAISSELVRTREELTRAVNGLLKLIEEFIQERHGAGRKEHKE